MTRFFLIILCTASFLAQANLPFAPADLKESDAFEETQPIPTTPATYENSIVAVVNNDVITMHDLNTRIKMLNPSIPKDQLANLRHAVLKQLINEQLMLQVIDRARISVTAQEIEEQISQTEQDRHLPTGKIHKDMEALGISRDVYQRPFKAQIGWSKYVRDAFSHISHVSEKDIEDRIKTQENKPRYLLSEIRLLFKTPEHQHAAEKAALHLKSQLERGASFADAAIQVSNSPSALNGGDIGWVLEDQLPEGTIDILRALPANSITSPILSKNKTYYTIYQLKDKIIPGVTASISVVARQMNIKISSEKDANAQLEALRKKFESITTCQQFDALEDQIPNAQLTIFNELPLSQMSPDLQTALKDLPIGQVSPGLINKEDNTLVFFLVCNRYESSISHEAKVEASDILSSQRLNLHAGKALRDLLRSSLIDVRI